MRVPIALVLALCYASAEKCDCHEGYQASEGADGTWCVGTFLDHRMPCNVPRAPRCVCDSGKITGILTDSEGTWCNHRENGREVKKWPCENAEEWKAYKVKVEEYHKSLKQ